MAAIRSAGCAIASTRSAATRNCCSASIFRDPAYKAVMKDVIIIGAGAAGLAAAQEMQRAGRSFTLIEAGPVIGGRALTDRTTFGVPIDLGCHWLHSPAQNPFAQAAARFGTRVQKGPQPKGFGWNGKILAGAQRDEASA